MWLVTAIDTNGGYTLDLIPVNGLVRGVMTDNDDPNEARDYHRAQRQTDMWVVHNEADLQPVIDFVTTNFVGRDVSIFKLQSVAVRVPGDLRTKNVSPDGILPG